MLCWALLGLLAVTRLSAAQGDGEGCGRVVCYHSNWSQYRPGVGKFFPEDIDPSLCTHLVYSFAKLDGNHLAPFEWNDDSTDWSTGLFERFQALKLRSPGVKTLLAVGGWNLGSAPFSSIVQSPSNRQDFVTHSISFLRDRGFDGLDLDWEYPGNRGSPPEDRDHFTELVRELRAAYDEEGLVTGRAPLLLTAAVAAGKKTIDPAYDIPAIASDLDFINVMTYDLHGAWDDVTGHNSPLYAGSWETEEEDRTLNMDWAARYWVERGAPAEKLTIGLGLYGRSFTLADPAQHAVGAAVASAGHAGTYTREAGFLSYYEICDLLASGGQRHVIEDQRVPYVHHGDQWVGYDDPDSLREKVRYIKKNKYGGVMVWALPLDDFSGGSCGQGPFPLMHAINDECRHTRGLLHNPVPAQSTTTPTPTTTTTTTTTTTSTTGPGVNMTAAATTSTTTQQTTTRSPSHTLHHSDQVDCTMTSDGFYASGRSCREYVICAAGVTYVVDCAPGLVFNPHTGYCDWPSNYQCTVGDAPDTTTSTAATTTGKPAVTTITASTTTTPQPTTTTTTTTITTTLKPTSTATVWTTRNITAEPTTTTAQPASPTSTTAPVRVLSTEKTMSHKPLMTSTYEPTSTAATTATTTSTSTSTTTKTPTTASTSTTTIRTPTSTGTADTTRAPTTPIVDMRTFCEGKSDGFYRDPADPCGGFIQCAYSFSFRQHCAPGSVFNAAISGCDNPLNVAECRHFYSHQHQTPAVGAASVGRQSQGGAVTTPSLSHYTTFCADLPDGLYADPLDCAYFLHCSHGVRYRKMCAPGTAFNPRGYCDRLANVPGCDHVITV